MVLAGYSVQGTLAYDLLSEPASVQALDGREIPRKETKILIEQYRVMSLSLMS